MKRHRLAMHVGEAGAIVGIALLVAGITTAAFVGSQFFVWSLALILLGPVAVYVSVIVTASYLERLEPAKYVHEG